MGKLVLIWIVWLGLVFWWLSPQIDAVKTQVEEHNKQIEKMINE